MKKSNKNKKQYKLSSLLHQPTLPYEDFHEKTKNKTIIPQLDPETWPEEWKKIYSKAYVRFPEKSLPSPTKLTTSLIQSLKKRKSTRAFSSKKLTLNHLSTLLYYSVGQRVENNKTRFYPSAGARYPLEIYLLSQNTELDYGLYHYYPKTHTLEKLFNVKKADIRKCFVDSWVENAGCIILFTAIFKRTTTKYSDRGYRYILTEAGHMAQNIYLLSASLNLACCAYEGFIDDKLHNVLDIDGLDEGVVYTMMLGQKGDS